MKILLFSLLFVGSCLPAFSFDGNWMGSSHNQGDSLIGSDSTKYQHRNLLTPTGRAMERRQFEWQNQYVFLINQFNVGVTDRVSASATVLAFPEIFGNGLYFGYLLQSSYVFTPRKSPYQLKFTGFFGKFPDAYSSFYGFLTSHSIGNKVNNLTLGIGYAGLVDGPQYEGEFAGGVVYTLAGNVATGPKGSLFLDNILVGEELYGSLGVRAKLRKFYFEIGLFYLVDFPYRDLGVLPMLGFGSNVLGKK